MVATESEAEGSVGGTVEVVDSDSKARSGSVDNDPAEVPPAEIPPADVDADPDAEADGDDDTGGTPVEIGARALRAGRWPAVGFLIIGVDGTVGAGGSGIGSGGERITFGTEAGWAGWR